MVVIVRCSRWRRRGVAQFNWLTMWRVEIGLAPGRLALSDLGSRRRAFQANDGLKRRQPLTVVGSIRRLAGLCWMGPDLGAERLDPFAPSEEALSTNTNPQIK